MGTVRPPLVPAPRRGAPEEFHSTPAGSKSSYSGNTGTIEYNYTHVSARNPVSFTRYGRVVVRDRAIAVLNRFLGRLMATARNLLTRPLVVCEFNSGDGFKLWRSS